MPADINIVGLVGQEGLVIEDDHLVILQSRSNTCRIWRIPFEQVTRIVVTRKWPWTRLILVSLLPGLPGLFFLWIGISIMGDGDDSYPFLLGFAAFFLLLSALIIVRYVWFKLTLIDMHYNLRERNLAFVVRPKKRQAFMDKLTAGIERVQARKWEEYTAAHPPRQVEEPADQPLNDPLPGLSPPSP